MKKVIGKCGECGGRVCMPEYFYSVNQPSPQCEKCHAIADDSLPVMKMREQTMVDAKDALAEAKRRWNAR